MYAVFDTLGPVHITPEGFENAALFLQLDLSSTLIRHKKGAFRKRYSNRKNLETPALRSSEDGKHFVNRAFWKLWHYDKRVISLSEHGFPEKQSQNDRVLSNFSGVVWTER